MDGQPAFASAAALRAPVTGAARAACGVCAVRASAGAEPAVSRRAALRLAAAALAGVAGVGPLLATTTASPKLKSQMTGNYKKDAKLMLTGMRQAVALQRGNPEMRDIVARVRQDMNDFVALYRRNGKVSGSTSYSVLYTASNTLSGHYASYGPLYPVPEKRRKRLVQQLGEVERALARGR